MKYSLLLFICLAGHSLFAQAGTDNIYGSWVKTKLTYKNGAELPDENILKYTYVKYTFESPDKMYISPYYYAIGGQYSFEINNNELVLKSYAGSILNTIRIEELGPDKLVLLQEGRDGFDDPTSLIYYFTPEPTYQSSLKLTADDIYSVTAGDTIYKENPKVYASYKGGNFLGYLTEHIGHGEVMHNKSGHIVASFIVSKAGIADSLKILQSISPEYDKYYTKAFKSARNDWKPSTLNGKIVEVVMFQEITYSTSDMMLPSYNNTSEANASFKEKNYARALYYYDEALKSIPTDKENLYNRGICKKMLGNLAGACEDWKKIKELGGSQADDLLAKYCH